jgi:hypothetical protein
MLSVAPDGTFWTLGYEMVNNKTSAPELNPDAGVLRHFDRAGNLLASAVPRSQFGKGYLAERRLGSGYIVATRKQLGWYSPPSGKGGQYTEIDLDSMTLHSYPGLPDLPESKQVVGFRLTESGNAFLSLYDNRAHHATNFMFDRGALKWTPIKGPAASEAPGSYLVGVDREKLVFATGPSPSAIFFSLSP